MERRDVLGVDDEVVVILDRLLGKPVGLDDYPSAMVLEGTPFQMPRGGMNTVKLGELLTIAQLNEVLRLVRTKQTAELRAYLQSLDSELQAKGVVPDYLYYCLCAMFKLG